LLFQWLGFMEQILVFRMKPDVLADKPAKGLDPQPVVPGVVQPGLDQPAAQAATFDGRRDEGMRENDDIPPRYILQHGDMPIRHDLEAMGFQIMSHVSVFSVQGLFSFRIYPGLCKSRAKTVRVEGVRPHAHRFCHLS